MSPWIGTTRMTILIKCPPKGYTWVGPRLTTKQTTTTPENIWQEHWSTLSKSSQRKAIKASEDEMPRLPDAKEQRGIKCSTSDDREFDDIMNNARRKLGKEESESVLRGDSVREDSGNAAVFKENSASASHVMAANLMDTISRPLGCSGQASDAVSAKTLWK